MLNRLLIIHRGGPTCVLNASTYGVIREEKNTRKKSAASSAAWAASAAC